MKACVNCDTVTLMIYIFKNLRGLKNYSASLESIGICLLLRNSTVFQTFVPESFSYTITWKIDKEMCDRGLTI